MIKVISNRLTKYVIAGTMATLLISFFTTCVEPYDFDDPNQEKLLLVDGRVTDFIGESYVKLGWTSPINNFYDTSISGANVYVVEDENINIPFYEVSAGLYMPAADFVGKVNSTYQLVIEYNNNQYQSDNVFIEKSVNIDSVYFDSQINKVNGAIIGEPRLNVKITSAPVTNDAQFYTYATEETWIVNALKDLKEYYKPNYVETIDSLIFVEVKYTCGASNVFYDLAKPDWVKNKAVPESYLVCNSNKRRSIQSTIFYQVPTVFNEITYDTIPLNTYKTCWSGINNTSYNLIASRDFANNQIKGAAVHSSKLDYRFTNKYSVLVKQFSLSPSAYKYISTIKSFVNNNISVYTSQPGYVPGNIVNANNAQEKIIGQFYGSSVSARRQFLSNSELDNEARLVVLSNYLGCNDGYYMIPIIDSNTVFLSNLRNNDPELYEYEINLLRFERNQYFENLEDTLSKYGALLRDVIRTEDLALGIVDMFIYTNKLCTDCRNYGSAIKPEFWND